MYHILHARSYIHFRRFPHAHWPPRHIKPLKTNICFLFCSNVFPSTYVEGLLFSWPRPCLSSLLDFLFLDTPGKTAAIVFVFFIYFLPTDPFLSPLVWDFLSFFIKIIQNYQTCVFYQLFCPLAGDFCWRRGWGWGGGEPIGANIFTTNQ